MSSTDVRPTPKPRPPKPSGGAASAVTAAHTEPAPVSSALPLESYPWFAGTMDRASAENAVQDGPGEIVFGIGKGGGGRSGDIYYDWG